MASSGSAGIDRQKPGGLMRWLARLPALVYPLRLSRLLGHRFILVHHRGRKTGKARRTMLEVVRFDRHTGESFVVSAWGEHADWYRNLQHGPAIAVETAGERFCPAVRFLDREERIRELSRYAREHRLAAKVIGRFLGLRLDGSRASIERAAHAVRMVAFGPEG